MSKKRRLKKLERIVEMLIDRLDEHHMLLYGLDEDFDLTPAPRAPTDKRMN